MINASDMVQGEIRIITASGAEYSIVGKYLRRKSDIPLLYAVDKQNTTEWKDLGEIDGYASAPAVGAGLQIAVTLPDDTRTKVVRSTRVEYMAVKAGETAVMITGLAVAVDDSIGWF